MADIQYTQLNGSHWLFDTELVGQPDNRYFDPEYWSSKNKLLGRAKGRGATLFVDVDNDQWAVRHYQRGGIIGKVIHDSYWYTGLERTRPWQEFHLLHELRQAGLNVPRPVAARVERRGVIYQADLVTQFIPNSHDLHHILCERPLTREEWRIIGESIAVLHRHQVYHHDLNLRNIMLDSQNRVWIIDFDRCYMRDGEDWKAEPVTRLKRSLEKSRHQEKKFNWSDTDWQFLLEGLNGLCT